MQGIASGKRLTELLDPAPEPPHGDFPCAMQVFSLDGRAMSQPLGAPGWCRAVARTAVGSVVCDRGCGHNLGRPSPSRDVQLFECPFGVSNAAARLVLPEAEGGAREVVLVGGRIFPDYARFSRFVENALKAGADLDALLDGSVALEFHDPKALEQVVGNCAQTLADNRAPSACLGGAGVGMDLGEDEIIRRFQGLGAPNWELLNRFLDAADGAADAAALRESMARELAAVTQAGRVSLFLLDPRGLELVLAGAEGLPGAVGHGFRLPVGEGIAGRVLAEHKPLVVEDIASRLDLTPSPHRYYASASFASLPLMAGTRCVGVLNLTDREAGGVFRATDAPWLEFLARLCAESLRRQALTDCLAKARQGASAEPAKREDAPDRVFEERLEREYERAHRHNRPLSLVLLKVDLGLWLREGFDDTVPDLVSQGVARVLGPAVRPYDRVMRYPGDGEVFAVLLPETGRVHARRIGERLRAAVHEVFLSRLPRQEDAEHAVSVDAGVAEYPVDASGSAELRDYAEQNLSAGERSQDASDATLAAGLPEVICMEDAVAGAPERTETPCEPDLDLGDLLS